MPRHPTLPHEWPPHRGDEHPQPAARAAPWRAVTLDGRTWPEAPRQATVVRAEPPTHPLAFTPVWF